MVKRSTTIQDMRIIDRLSDLPDSILHHILSFVDTKSSVQTCILSRRWRSVWKYVDVLTFNQSWLPSNRGFERCVDQILSLRCDCSRVRKVRTEFWQKQSMHLLERMMKYAASHGVQELFIFPHFVGWLDVVRSVCLCSQSLKVLELNKLLVEKKVVELWSCLELLESLTLTSCCLNFDHVADDAFAANFPRLETLKLDRCFHYNDIQNSVLKITGSKLLNLEIVCPAFGRIQISGPKLQSLSLENVHAFFDSSDNDSKKQMLLERCANLFKMVHNVQALDPQVETFELLIQTCGSVEHQASPFKRMKFLNLKCCRGSREVPDQVIHYFLGGSPNEEDPPPSKNSNRC